VGIKPINPPICLTLNLDEAAFLKIGKVLGDLYLGLA
jgi:hypothetical protein